MVAERNYLVELLKQSGIKSQVYTSMKRLKQSGESHVGAVLRNSETFERSGSKQIFVDQEGRRCRRVKLWERTASFRVVIADNTDEKVEEILVSFLRGLKKGLPVENNWVALEIGEADWVDAEDSILRSKVAVQFDITFKGGIYEDRLLKRKAVGSTEAGKEKDDGKN